MSRKIWLIGRALAAAARRFASARDGNVAMIWALVGSVLIGLVGLSIDFTRAQMIRQQLQNAADGAALVAERSSSMSFAQREALARAFFDTEAGDYANVNSFTLTELSSGGHRIDVGYIMDTGLARVVKQENWTIGVASEAEAQASPPIEVVLALDNTGSMRWDMDTLRQGAEDLADFLLSIDGDTVSVGLVPFVAQVNIGNQSSHLAWMDTDGANPYHAELLEDRYMGYRQTANSVVASAPQLTDGFALADFSNPLNALNRSTQASFQNAAWRGSGAIFSRDAFTTASFSTTPFAARAVSDAYFQNAWGWGSGGRWGGGATQDCSDTSKFPTSYGGFAVRWIQGPINGMSGTSDDYCYAFAPSNINLFDVYNNLPSNAQWGGCVETRPPPYDINDAAPNQNNPVTRFVPFFSLDDGGDIYYTDNNWITSSTYDRTDVFGLGGAFTAASDVRTSAIYKYRSGVPVSISNSNSGGRGPNRGCPTPIVPLTTNENTVVSAIRGMDYWNGGGTNQAEGLAWAWRVISPGAPFTEGRPYNDPTDPVRKVIVLFTDGDNTSLNSDNPFMQSDYAALNYRSLWRDYQYETVPDEGEPGIPAQYRLDPNFSSNSSYDSSRMVTYMNNRQRDLCDAIKAAGIEIYTIGFGISSGGTADLLLQYCATQDGSHYYHADDSDELLEAFSAIGSGIGDLRITN